MPKINMLLINLHNNVEHSEVLINRQAQFYKKCETARNYDLFSIGFTVVVQWEDG